MLKRVILSFFVICSAAFLTACDSDVVLGPYDEPAEKSWAERPTRVVNVPSSIDATGSKDVSAAMASFIKSVPDNSVIKFKAGTTYRMESTLVIENRKRLHIDGNGARFIATTPGDRNRANVRLLGGEGIVINDLVVKGANPYAGRLNDDAWDVDKEAQHGFDILSTHGGALNRVKVTDVYGDFIHFGREYYGDWADDIVVRDSTFERNGRQGIAFFAARNIVVENNSFDDMRRSTFDFEPGRGGRDLGVDNVVIRNNDIGAGRLLFVAAHGWGQVDNIRIEGNRAHAQALQMYVDDASGGRRKNWKILNNTSYLTVNNPKGAAMRFHRVDNVEVRGNRQSFTPGFNMALVLADDACNTVVNSNQVPGAVTQLRRTGTC